MMELNSADIPSMNNIYDSTYWEKVRNKEQSLSNDLYDKAQTPFETGYVSQPSYSSVFNGEYNNRSVKSLTGNDIDITDFKHKNMQPFIKGNVTQVTSDIQNTRLQINTGNDIYYKNKKEIEPFFSPTNSYLNKKEMDNNRSFIKDRINITDKQNNTSPIESVRVGSGLGLGYGSEGSGGFQQLNTAEYAAPRSIDELRSKINQKSSTFQIPFQGPSKGIDKRAEVNPFDKNKPERVFNQTEDNWFKTTGNVLKETDRPIENLKATSRIKSHVDYVGPTNTNNLHRTDDNYGKNSIIVYNNERQLTETRTIQTNLTTNIKAMIAPILDVLKITNKSYLVEAPRAVGNVSIQIPEKATVYDPINHIMKTTVKETTIHDSEMTNLTGPDQSYSALYDTSRTTTKETTIHDSEMTNLSGPDETYSALYDTSRTTTKETSIHNNQTGNLAGQTSSYINNEDKAKKTVRETMKNQDYTRNIGGVVCKIQVYDSDVVAKTTVKETTVKTGGTMFGFLGGVLDGIFGGYLSAKYNAKNTQKQFTSDYENFGIAGSKDEFHQMDRQAAYNAEIDGTREMLMINAGYTPGAGGKYVGLPKENINMNINKKQIDLEQSTRDSNNIGRIFDNGPVPIEDDNTTRNINMPNAFKDRLDSNLLSSLKSNDLNISINPI